MEASRLRARAALGRALASGLVAALVTAEARGQAKTPNALATAPGIVTSPSAAAAGGTGGTAARVEVGGMANGTGTTKDPTAGTAFDDTTTPGLSRQLTIAVGTAYKRPYSQVKGLPIEVAEDLRYNVQSVNAKANGNRLFSSAGALQSATTVALSNALQTVAANSVTGQAQAQVVDKTALAFAAGLNNDPTVFTQLSPGQPIVLQFSIGAGFTLTAEDPAQSAEALYEIATDQPGEGQVLAFDIHIDGTTRALDASDIDVLQFNPSLFASAQAIQNYLLSQLAFDPASHTVTSAGGGPILLYQTTESAGVSSVTATFNYGAIATAVPEPSSLALCGVGLAGAVAYARRRRARA